MNSETGFGSTFKSRPRTDAILGLILLSLLLPYIPVLNLVTAPMTTFVTAVHEISHAIACLLTGGHVGAMTIVNDNQGHGGLTFCEGGLNFIYTQAGYIGTALFGSLLIWLGRYPRISKVVLLLIGLAIAGASLTFMFGTILLGGFKAGFLSMVFGLLIAGVLIFISLRSTFYTANIVLLFLGVQTGMNAIESATWLFNPAGSSDASAMAAITGLPAFVWSCFWLLFALVTVGSTVWSVMKADSKRLDSI